MTTTAGSIQTPSGAGADAVRTVSFVSLGCPKNLVDSEKMLGVLAESGLEVVSADAGEDADAIVVNTCGFLEASKEESLGVIRAAVEKKRAGLVKRVVVAGCLVQRHRTKLLEWAPGIDAMVGVFDRDHIVDAVGGPAARLSLAEASDGAPYWIAGNALQAARQRGVSAVGLTVNGRDGKGVGYFESDSARLRLTPRHYAYLRMSEGCNQRCAFCTIPSIRGKMRSKPIERVVDEARELLDDGAFELNLIGQDTTSYGDDIGIGLRAAGSGAAEGFASMGGLPALLHAVNEAVEKHGPARGEGGAKGWARLMYAYPSTFTREMIDALADLPHVVKYIDMPLQHASDRMLKAMRRNVSASRQRELVHELRERIPGLALRTTFITGFPGETEEDHEQLMAFVEEVGFDMMGVFEYSREEGTPAGTMDLDPALHVPAEVKARRKHELMTLQREIAFEQARFLASDFDPARPGETGHRFDVLIDAPAGDGAREADDHGGEAAPTPPPADEPALRAFRGRAYFQAPQIDSVVHVRSRAGLEPGSLVRCTVVGASGYDLIARPSAELDATAPATKGA